MSAPKFTPGPWYAKAGVSQMVSDDTTIWSAPKPNADLSRWFVFADADDHGDSEATARLISAAPELYEALTELLAVDEDWHGSVNSEMSAARVKARAALAKVRP